MVSKALASLDAWLELADRVLEEQPEPDQSVPGRPKLTRPHSEVTDGGVHDYSA